MRKRRFLSFLLMVSLVINSCFIVHAEDYVGPEYDKDGFLLSPDELNANRPESTYYDNFEKLLATEEDPTSSTELDIDYHSESEEPEDATPYVTLESYPLGTDIPDFNVPKDAVTFYSFINDANTFTGDFSNVRCWGTLSSNKSSFTITLHVLEKAFTSASFTFSIYDYNDKFIKRTKFPEKRLDAGVHKFTYALPVHSTIKEKVLLHFIGWNGTVPYEASCTHYRYNFEGGAYGRLKALEGERHHMPAKAAIEPLTAYSGPAARILKSDHRQTSSCSKKLYVKKQKDLILHGKFLEAQKMDFVELIQLNPAYNRAINEVKEYTKSLGYVGTVRLGWQYINNHWYYYDRYQNMQTGWIKSSNVWYFLSHSNGIMQTGWIQDSNQWYYLDSSGAICTGWLNLNGQFYYLNPSTGAMQTGWLQLNNQWYYLEPSTGAMWKGWKNIDNQWYYFEPATGAMWKGWKNIDNQWYYLEPSTGAMWKGWKNIDSQWYYFKSSGVMACNETLTLNGKEYHFDSNGYCSNPYNLIYKKGVV